VLSVDSEEGAAYGSGRSIRQFHLLEALESMADLFTRFGGHRHAAGVVLSADRVEEFRRRLNECAAARLTRDDLVPEFEVDSLLDLREISEEAIQEILALAPFGCGNPAPLFAALDVEVAGEPVVWKEKHARVILRRNGRKLTMKGWGLASRLDELRSGSRVDAILAFEEDPYSLSRGYSGWSAVLKDVRQSGIGSLSH